FWTQKNSSRVFFFVTLGAGSGVFLKSRLRRYSSRAIALRRVAAQAVQRTREGEHQKARHNRERRNGAEKTRQRHRLVEAGDSAADVVAHRRAEEPHAHDEPAD